MVKGWRKRTPDAQAAFEATAKIRYAASPAARAARVRAVMRYHATEKGRRAKLALQAAYNSSEKGRATEFRRRAKRYGTTAEALVALHERQGGACGVCGSPLQLQGERNSSGVAHIDHDHETGAVRGLLCWPCNTGIGLLGDSPERLGRAVVYLTGGQR
jgi:Recombination endonuclease VII